MEKQGDRRRYARHAVENLLHLSGVDGEVTVLSANISAGGMLVRGTAGGAVGARITIAIEGLGEVTGRIVRTGETTGIAFDLSAEEQEKLAADILRLLRRAMPV